MICAKDNKKSLNLHCLNRLTCKFQTSKISTGQSIAIFTSTQAILSQNGRCAAISCRMFSRSCGCGDRKLTSKPSTPICVPRSEMHASVICGSITDTRISHLNSSTLLIPSKPSSTQWTAASRNFKKPSRSCRSAHVSLSSNVP